MIRNKYKKIIAMLVATLLIGGTFVGCTNSSKSNDSGTSTSTEQTANTTLLGKVKSIDGNKITILLGEESTTSTTETEENSQGSQGQTSNPPEKPDAGTSTDGSTAAPQGGAPTDAGQQGGAPTDGGTGPGGTPPSDANATAPQGGGASTGNSSKTSFTLNGEEKTIGIENENNISVQKGSKSISGGLVDITIGSILSVSYDSAGKISSITVESNNSSYTGGSQTGSITLTGAKSVDAETKTSTNEQITSTTSNQNGVLVKNAGNLEITGATINKSGDTTSDDESNFYGVNAAVAATSASTIKISDTTITTDSDGSNGIFATGDGSVINVSNVTINTTKDSSRGLDATYNGTVIAKDTNITTKGAHCAALATDRGEGTIHATGGTMNTSGDGSPGIYSTGNITATGTIFNSTGSQAAVVEGKNSITVNDCTLTGAIGNGVMLYQSFSGDSGVGTSYFNMTGGSLTALEGPMFYITNTDSQITLKGATLKTSSGILINAATGKWGTEGSNGGKVTLNTDSQSLEGNITCDKISTAALNLTNKSSLAGTINGDNTAKSVTLSLDKESTWTVTGTSYLTVLADADEDLSNIKDNGNTIYYDSSNSENSWLNAKTITLSGGGTLKPIQ